MASASGESASPTSGNSRKPAEMDQAFGLSQSGNSMTLASPGNASLPDSPTAGSPRSEFRRKTTRVLEGPVAVVDVDISAEERSAGRKSTINNRPSFGRRNSKRMSTRKLEPPEGDPGDPPGSPSKWKVLKNMAKAADFVTRLGAGKTGMAEDDAGRAIGVGSLKTFLDYKQIVEIADFVEVVPDSEDVSARNTNATDDGMDAISSALTSVGPAAPVKLTNGPRRKVVRLGNQISKTRAACPRNQQLSNMLIDLQQEEQTEKASTPITNFKSRRGPPRKLDTHNSIDTDGSKQVSLHLASSFNSDSEREHEESTLASAQSHLVSSLRAEIKTSRRFPDTNFSQLFLSNTTTGAKARSEQHPLLVAIDAIQDNSFIHGELQAEQAKLAQRLEELRSRRHGQIGTTSSLDRRRLYGNDGMPPMPHVLTKLGSSSGRQAEGTKRSRFQQDVDILLELVDPDQTGKVSPDVFVPLMFWLGLTRRRSAALTTLELAFGPGDIDTAKIMNRSDYVEVQVRLVDGLRQLARRESLEQLCEFMTDPARVRTWFYSMKRDPYGHVDVAEVQNLFARMEVTRDRQALFRFLRHELHGGSFNYGVFAHSTAPSAARAGDEKDSATQPARNFGISEFSSMLCKATFAWLIHRMIVLIHPAAVQDFGGSSPGFEGENFAATPADRSDLALRWTQLQRKITVSLLVNHRFWGRESRGVLTSLRQTAKVIGDDLTPEQWLSLFQRVRAQGMSSTLPVGDEADDPDFLKKRTQHENLDV